MTTSLLHLLLTVSLLVSCINFVSSSTCFRFNSVTNAAGYPARYSPNIELTVKDITFNEQGTGNPRTVPANSLILYGGGKGSAISDTSNDVWLSNYPDPTTWYLVSGEVNSDVYAWNQARYASFKNPPNRHAHATTDTGRQYILGGELGEVVYNWVWYSDDLINWTNQTIIGNHWVPSVDAGATAISTPITAARHTLFYIGGYGTKYPYISPINSDVWATADGGITWERRATGQFPPRRSFPVVSYQSSYFNGAHLLYVLTGATTDGFLSDVWVSSNGGRQWSQVTATGQFGVRADATAEVSSEGVLVLIGGLLNGAIAQNDVYVSLDGGYSWSNLGEMEFPDRFRHSSLFDQTSRIVISAGLDWLDKVVFFNDVWRSELRFNHAGVVNIASSCGLTVPVCNSFGLTCWPGASDTHVTISPKFLITCPACAGTSESSTTTTSSGTAVAFLIIFLLLFLVTFVICLYLLFALRPSSTPSSLPVPKFVTDWWNGDARRRVNLNSELGDGDTKGDSLYVPLTIK